MMVIEQHIFNKIMELIILMRHTMKSSTKKLTDEEMEMYMRFLPDWKSVIADHDDVRYNYVRGCRYWNNGNRFDWYSLAAAFELARYKNDK
jgi:hypothetical protein